VLTTDAASAVGTASIRDRAPSGRMQGSEGQKVRLAQDARLVDPAIRPVLAGSDLQIARRVWLTGGRVLAVRADDIPDGGPIAAILSFPI